MVLLAGRTKTTEEGSIGFNHVANRVGPRHLVVRPRLFEARVLLQYSGLPDFVIGATRPNLTVYDVAAPPEDGS